jgi:hypothetical protein
MRFAWLQKNSASPELAEQAASHPLSLIRKAYNAVFWIFLLPFIFTAIDYGTGFIAFTVVIFARLIVVLYMNNILDLTPQEYETYPFRIP